MTAGAFRIADDFPAIAKQQRIIQATDENPLFVVDMADLVKDTEEKLSIYSYWDMSREQRAAADKMRLADAGIDMGVDLHAEDVLTYWNMMLDAPNGVVPKAYVGMDMGREALRTATIPDPPKPNAAIHVMTDDMREVMRLDRRFFDDFKKIEPVPHHKGDEDRGRDLEMRVTDAISKTVSNCPKCAGVDVVLDAKSYHSFVDHLVASRSWYRHNDRVGIVYLGARIMMYDCREPLLEARPRWR